MAEINTFAWKEREKAWFRNYRETKGTTRSDINPYPEIFHTRDNVYSLFVLCTHNKGDTWMHLVVGPEKALLIDSGFGLGDLKGLCEHLAGGKPVIVANTHNHGDHAGGNSQWDEAYCHEYEVPMMEYQQYPEYWDEFNHVGEPVAKDNYKREDVIPFRKYKVIGVPNHYKFDLGQGYEIELIHVPGHTPGGAVYLDRQNRILFSGDALMPITHTYGAAIKPYYQHTEYSSITAWRNGLVELSKYADDFDRIYAGHGGLEFDKVLLTDLIDACNEIIADPNSNESFREINGSKQKFKIHGTANIVYCDERI